MAISEKATEGAIRELRVAATALATTALVWILTSGAVTGTLLARERAGQLAAWLLVRDEFEGDAEKLKSVGSEGVSCFVETVPIQSGTDVDVCEPFILRLPWPGEETVSISLSRSPDATSAVLIHGESSRIPITSYAIGLLRAQEWIVPVRYVRSNRDLYNAVLRDGLAEPVGWGAIRTYLHSAGWSGSSAEDLEIDDRAVAQFIKDGFTASYSISGVPFSAGYYPAAVSVVLGVIAFTLVGPLLKLRHADRAPPDSSWVMLSVWEGRPRRLLGHLQAVASCLLVVLPVAVLVTQALVLPHMTRAEQVATVASFVGPVALAGTNVAIALQMGRLRG